MLYACYNNGLLLHALIVDCVYFMCLVCQALYVKVKAFQRTPEAIKSLSATTRKKYVTVCLQPANDINLSQHERLKWYLLEMILEHILTGRQDGRMYASVNISDTFMAELRGVNGPLLGRRYTDSKCTSYVDRSVVDGHWCHAFSCFVNVKV